ncbi:hypothetical protein KY342_00505 [Candidatus Woesearchaeota archaeon]|nr:hypothetical protein [Candidatus Woesearchaeota archaeon]
MNPEPIPENRIEKQQLRQSIFENFKQRCLDYITVVSDSSAEKILEEIDDWLQQHNLIQYLPFEKKLDKLREQYQTMHLRN